MGDKGRNNADYGPSVQATLDHIVLTVGDVEASLGFYVGTLGLVPYRLDAYREGTVLFPSIRVNDATIIDLLPPQLWSEEDEESGRENLHHFCICVDAADWDPLNQRLAEARVSIEAGPMTLSGARGDGTAIYINDPDDNLVELRYYD